MPGGKKLSAPQRPTASLQVLQAAIQGFPLLAARQQHAPSEGGGSSMRPTKKSEIC